MKVAIIRHGEVDYRWSRRCTSAEFDKECSEYDKAPIKDTSYKTPPVECRKVYISTLPRSLETALKIFGDRNFIATELISEVPLRSGFDTEKKLPLWFWNITGRMQWVFNVSRQAESRRRTKNRARKFVKMLCRADEDCAVVTHGFYMHTLLGEMKKAGFRTDRTHAVYKNGECVIAEKKK